MDEDFFSEEPSETAKPEQNNEPVPLTDNAANDLPSDPKRKVELDDAQKLLILNEWNSRKEAPPSIPELIKLAFKKDLDPRSKEGRAIREYLASRQIVVPKAGEYVPKAAVELTTEQQEYISNNCVNMNGVEMARTLFNKPGLTNLDKETRAVLVYLNSLDKKVSFDKTDYPEGNYVPPKSLVRVISRINKYAHEGLDIEKLTAKQKKECFALIGFLHNYRFLHQINNYEENTDRELLESAFVNYTFDKSDLTAEEIDQYIVLATDKVNAASISKHVSKLQRLLDEVTEDSDRKISMSLIEAINTARTEYNECIKRQQTLLKDLKIKRSERIGSQIKDSATVLNLVQAWKDEESRQRLIRFANLRKEKIKDEIDRLSSMDEIRARIFGISANEILEG